jgi:purine nucleosidase
MRPLLIDTDPGVDDALAILMCFAADQAVADVGASAESVRVQALTVCGGNVGLQHTLRNALRLAQFAPYPVPVYAGADRALLARTPDAAFVHGNDGLGDVEWASAPSQQPEPLHAALALLEYARRYAGVLEVLMLGPLTNLALALALEPELPHLLGRVTVMGGALDQVGNITAFAEFNIAVDPDAAAIVFERIPDLCMVDWGQSVRLAPSIAQTEAWLDGTSAAATLMRQTSRRTLAFKRSLAAAGQDDAQLPWAWADPLAAHVALQPARTLPDPSLALHVLREGAASGATLRHSRAPANVRVPDLNRDAFHHHLEAVLTGPS